MIAVTFLAMTVFAAGETITVAPDEGPGVDYTVIQEAINASSAGDTIYIMNGGYYEMITIDKDITLRGEIAGQAIINGSNLWDVVTILADNVTIIDLTIEASNHAVSGIAGIHIEGSNCTISGCIVRWNRNGIIIKDALEPYGHISNISIVDSHFEDNQWGVNAYLNSSGVSVRNCTFINNSDGVQFWSSDDGSVLDCSFDNNVYAIDMQVSNRTAIEGVDIVGRYYGIQMVGCNDVTVRSTNITDAPFGGFTISNCLGIGMYEVVMVNSLFTLAGDDSGHYATHTIENCTSDGEGIQYLVGLSDSELSIGGGPVYLIDGANVTMRDANRTSLRYGFVIVNCTGVTIENVSFSQNVYDLRAIDCTDLTVSGCVFEDPTYRSVWITRGSGTALIDNDILNGTGIYLDSSTDHELMGNRIASGDIIIVGDELDHFLGTWTNNTVDEEPVIYVRDVHSGTFTIEGSLVYLVNCTGIGVENETISHDILDLNVYFCDDLHFTDVTFNGSEIDGMVRNSTVSFLNNSITSDLELVAYDSRIVFRDNVLENEDLSIRYYDPVSASFERNDITSGSGRISVTRGSCNVSWNDLDGCSLWYGSVQDSMVLFNDLNGSEISLFTCEYMTISNNIVMNASTGLLVERGSHLSIASNEFTSVGSGIVMNTADNCTISSNEVLSDQRWGSGISVSISDSEISDNICEGLSYGIGVDSSDNLTISGNHCDDNAYSGIKVGRFTTNSTVTANDCEENTYGIEIDPDASRNVISWNVLINNTLGINGNGTNNTFLNNTVEDRKGSPPGPSPTTDGDDDDMGIRVEDLICVISLFVFVIVFLISAFAPKHVKRKKKELKTRHKTSQDKYLRTKTNLPEHRKRRLK